MAIEIFTAAGKAEIRALREEVAALKLRVTELSTALSTSSNAALRVHVDEVEAALESLQRSNRKELGKLWKLLGARDEPPVPPPSESKDERRAAILKGRNHLGEH